jgi:hypothetical protein
MPKISEIIGHKSTKTFRYDRADKTPDGEIAGWYFVAGKYTVLIIND